MKLIRWFKYSWFDFDPVHTTSISPHLLVLLLTMRELQSLRPLQDSAPLVNALPWASQAEDGSAIGAFRPPVGTGWIQCLLGKLWKCPTSKDVLPSWKGNAWEQHAWCQQSPDVPRSCCWNKVSASAHAHDRYQHYFIFPRMLLHFGGYFSFFRWNYLKHNNLLMLVEVSRHRHTLPLAAFALHMCTQRRQKMNILLIWPHLSTLIDCWLETGCESQLPVSKSATLYAQYLPSKILSWAGTTTQSFLAL